MIGFIPDRFRFILPFITRLKKDNKKDTNKPVGVKNKENLRQKKGYRPQGDEGIVMWSKQNSCLTPSRQVV